MKKIITISLLFVASILYAQVPLPQVPVTGNIGAGGVFPVLNSGVLVMASDANRTMVYPETSAFVLKITSSVSLTATRNLFAPLQLGFAFAVENFTTGGQSICVGATTGACVTIPNGQVSLVYCDGVNYIDSLAGSGSGTVSSGTAGQVAQYPSSGTTVQGATISGDATLAVGGTLTVSHSANSSAIDGVVVTGTPTTGQVPTATGPTAATWQTPGGGSGPTPIAGATADYDFLQGTGTTLTDISGNGNDGTFGSNVPTWVSNGLQFNFNQSVNLPSALNSTKTFYLAFYLNPIVPVYSAFTPQSFPLLLNSTLGNVGINILTAQQNDGTSLPSFVPTLVDNANFSTASTLAISGFHVLTVTLGTSGTSLDHIYVDGVEVSPYQGQLASFGFQSSGNFILGAGDPSGFFNGSGFTGTFYRAAFLTNEDSPAEVTATYQKIIADMQARAVPTMPVPLPQSIPQLYAVGDSITYGNLLPNPLTGAWPVNLTLTNQPAYNINNMGIVGISLWALAGSEPNRVSPMCTTGAGPAVAIIFAGTNDFNSSTPTLIYNHLSSWIQSVTKAGCRVFVGTMIDRGGNDAGKNAYDALILTSALSAGAFGIIDFAAAPVLGADGASADPTWFDSDQVHPTQAGQTLLAQIASNSLNYYFGATPASPTIVTTSTYQMLSGDGYVTANPASANQTLTLPDCTGPSGVIYAVGNIQAAFTVTVDEGSSAQPINGLTSVAIPSNSSAYFKDVANDKSVSGCHWEQVSQGSSGGGSAITSLTGDVTASGPGAAAATVAAVHATSGTLDGVTIGATTPSTAAVTTETVTTSVTAQATSSATSGANINSPFIDWCGNYWTGSASAADCWTSQVTFTAGANPASTLVFAHTGSSGGANISVPANLLVNNIFSSGVLNGANITGTSSIDASTSSSATSSANFNSPPLESEGQYWTGSITNGDVWSWIDVLGSGTNPTSTYTLSHSGTSGASNVSIPNLGLATKVVNAQGLQVATGAACTTTTIIGASCNATITLAVTAAGTSYFPVGCTIVGNNALVNVDNVATLTTTTFVVQETNLTANANTTGTIHCMVVQN